MRGSRFSYKEIGRSGDQKEARILGFEAIDAARRLYDAARPRMTHTTKSPDLFVKNLGPMSGCYDAERRVPVSDAR